MSSDITVRDARFRLVTVQIRADCRDGWVRWNNGVVYVTYEFRFVELGEEKADAGELLFKDFNAGKCVSSDWCREQDQISGNVKETRLKLLFSQ